MSTATEFGTPSNIFQAADIRTAWYFYKLKMDDFVAEFCVANADDTPTDDFPEGQWVATRAPDQTLQRWAKSQVGDLLVFRPPDGYTGGQGLEWHYDKRLQRHQAADREAMERYALGNRVSVAM